MKVRRAGGNIVIELDKARCTCTGEATKVELPREDAEKLLALLSNTLSYRVLKMHRSLAVEEVSRGTAIVRFREGRRERVAALPLGVLRAHIKVLGELVGKTVSKREYVEMVVSELTKSGSAREAKMAAQFDWEKFIGSRSEYYVLYYIPMLLLRRGGFVDFHHTRIRVLEAPASVHQVLSYAVEGQY